jgi:hypothetical protein
LFSFFPPNSALPRPEKYFRNLDGHKAEECVWILEYNSSADVRKVWSYFRDEKIVDYVALRVIFRRSKVTVSCLLAVPQLDSSSQRRFAGIPSIQLPTKKDVCEDVGQKVESGEILSGTLIRKTSVKEISLNGQIMPADRVARVVSKIDNETLNQTIP